MTDHIPEQKEEAIRQVVQDELEKAEEEGTKIGRRGVLGGLAAAAGVGAVSGSAAGQKSGGDPMSIAAGSLDVDDSFRVAGSLYAGPASAKPASPSTNDQVYWDVTDAGANYVIRREYWNGSSWNKTGMEVQDLHSQSINTERATISKDLSTDLSDYNPFPVRGPEAESLSYYRPTMAADNPTLTASDVTDRANPVGVADPFMRPIGGQYHALFEVLSDTETDAIGHATSPDGYSWTYNQIVLDGDSADYTASRFAYPHFFVWDGTVYMVPDSSGDIFLLKTSLNDFPTGWTEAETIIGGSTTIHDFTPFFYEGRWYAIGKDSTNSQIDLWVADQGTAIEGRTWSQHPASPIHSTGGATDGPAGRPVVTDNGVFFFYQDTRSIQQVSAFHISELTETNFSDAESGPSPVFAGIAGGDHWQNATHHIDICFAGLGGETLAIGDGNNGDWNIGMLAPCENAPTEFSVYASSGISGAGGKLSFDGVNYDHGRNHDPTNDVYVVPQRGIYRFEARVTWQNPDASNLPYRVILKIVDKTNSSNIVFAPKELNLDQRHEQTIVGTTSTPLAAGTEVALEAQTDFTTDIQGGGIYTEFRGKRVF